VLKVNFHGLLSIATNIAIFSSKSNKEQLKQKEKSGAGDVAQSTCLENKFTLTILLPF
jgi:hypothetical protein